MAFPEWGTAPIKCSKRGCKWKGYETDLAHAPAKIVNVTGTTNVCPTCGCDSYYFMTKRQIDIWEKQKADACRKKEGER